MLKTYCPGYENRLNDQFTEIRNLSYGTFNVLQGIDTGPFRRSVWYYVHRLFGIFHDDFNLKIVNDTLPIQLKNYIKKISCYPNLIERSDLDLEISLQPSEKVHIALLASESKKQAELLYFLSALSKSALNK